MARVNVEMSAIVAAESMSEAMGWKHGGCLYHLCLIWSISQEQGKAFASVEQIGLWGKLPKSDLIKFIRMGGVFGFFSFVDPLRETDLGIEIKGNQKHIDNLERLKAGRAEGGRSRVNHAKRDEKGKLMSKNDPGQAGYEHPGQPGGVDPAILDPAPSAMQCKAMQCNSKEEESTKVDSPRRHAPGVPSPDEFLKTWNDNCQPLSKAQALNAERRRKIKSRLTDKPDLEYWRNVIHRLAASEFCRLGTWANIDWLIANDTNHLKVNEGKYDNKNQQVKSISQKEKTDAEIEHAKKMDAWAREQEAWRFT